MNRTPSRRGRRVGLFVAIIDGKRRVLADSRWHVSTRTPRPAVTVWCYPNGLKSIQTIAPHSAASTRATVHLLVRLTSSMFAARPEETNEHAR
jgi:hypothetical protein